MKKIAPGGILVLAMLGSDNAAAQNFDWQHAPRMTLERQYAGPLTDTIIQRLRDPVDGSVCYVYLPVSAAHSERTDSGYVQYGANTIGSISCTASSSQVTGSTPTTRKH